MSIQYLECQNRFIAPNSNVTQNSILMSKLDIWPQFECQNYISKDFEWQNSIFGPNSNDKIGFQMSKCDIRRKFESQNRISYVKLGLRISKCDIQPEFECQNGISNVKMRYSVRIGMSK